MVANAALTESTSFEPTANGSKSAESPKANQFKRQIQKAIQSPDDYAIHFIYVTDDKVSIRAVSPYRWNGNSFFGLCLSKENHRQFRLDRIHKLRLVKSSEVVMPFQITECLVENN